VLWSLPFVKGEVFLLSQHRDRQKNVSLRMAAFPSLLPPFVSGDASGDRCSVTPASSSPGSRSVSLTPFYLGCVVAT